MAWGTIDGSMKDSDAGTANGPRKDVESTRWNAGVEEIREDEDIRSKMQCEWELSATVG